MYDNANIFAKIIRNEIPCDKVAESEHSLAFRDLHPQAKIHVLVIPKGRYEDIVDFTANASAAEQTDFWNLVREVAPVSFRLQANTGEGAGQSVPHFHAHIISD